MASKVRSSIFLKVAAPIYVPIGDNERLEEASEFPDADVAVKASIAKDEFWQPFLQSRNSFDKMALAISSQHGWPDVRARKMLATAMSMYEPSNEEYGDPIVDVIHSVEDMRLWRWCVGKLARSALSIQQDFPPTHKSGAEEVISRSEKYVINGKSEELELSVPEQWLFVEDMTYARQDAAQNGDGFLAGDAISPRARRLAVQLIEVLEDESLREMMLGYPGTELAFIAWSGPLIGQDEDAPDPVGNVSVPYLYWALRVFAFGHAFRSLLSYASKRTALNVDFLQKEILKGYEVGRSILRDALMSYPPAPRWSLQDQNFEWY